MAKSMTSIVPVLMCGGAGTRLWPLSRKSYPKQFVPLIGDTSLFQASALRLTGGAFTPPLVLTNADFRFIVQEQLTDIEIDDASIMIEPDARNTAPAILAAALHLQKTQPDALMLIAPSDHVIQDSDAFLESINAAVDAAQKGQLVTFGIQPTHPETGYGYLELSKPVEDNSLSPIKLKRFVEKPSATNARKMVNSGDYLWNAGIFLFSVKSIVEAFQKHEPGMVECVSKSVDDLQMDLGFMRLDPESWNRAQSISIDYAVMERTENLSVVPFSGGWSDLGGWDAVLRETGPDKHGVSTSGHVTVMDCQDSLIRSEDNGLEVVGIGLKNIIAVAMPDAVLIADASRAQDVKLAVTELKAKQARQAEQFPRDYRPWGWFESIAMGERFQVKRIQVKPGQSLSLQSHHHRAEHWIVVSGTAKVTINEDVKLVTENQSVYIPVGSVHRLENPGKLPVVLIEVQTGSYLGEDDIIRYEDKYARD
ncbi:Mannose-1-phosphate guanylyltransferase (GDP) [hydrothermal vent metagenome]|uniref:mannose-1-phosphate guanylyltransferase n=2 Tax=root TaxID=1 RepID=A0A161JQG0_9ZZZZ